MNKMPQHSASNMPSKVKVLALHGYRQNADTFKSKLGSFRKFVSKYADFVFVSAPHIAPPIKNENTDSKGAAEVEDGSQRSWWFNKDDGTFKGTNKDGPAIGFQESLKLLEKVWREENCQGLLGFSQGACFVGLLCDLSARGMTSIKPLFAILSSGFKSESLVHLNYYESKNLIPSLHIYGESDEIIPKELSIRLAETYAEGQILTHPGGHYFPAQASLKNTYMIFFQVRLQEYLEAKELEHATLVHSVVVDEVPEEYDDSDD